MTSKNDQEPQIYEVTHRLTGEKRYQAATNAEDACKQACWLIGDCFAITQKPRYKPVPDHAPLVLVKLPCEVCPFQYAECLRPPDQDCPAQPNTPELNEWLKQAAQAHLCQYGGDELVRTDYEKGQKWVPIKDAIKLLAPSS